MEASFPRQKNSLLQKMSRVQKNAETSEKKRYAYGKLSAVQKRFYGKNKIKFQESMKLNEKENHIIAYHNNYDLFINFAYVHEICNRDSR